MSKPALSSRFRIWSSGLVLAACLAGAASAGATTWTTPGRTPATPDPLSAVRSRALAELALVQDRLAPLEATSLASRIQRAPTVIALDAARRDLRDLALTARPMASLPLLPTGPELKPTGSSNQVPSVNGQFGRPTLGPAPGRGVWMPSPDSD